MIASGPDLLRLLIIPVFAWAAWRDIETRRLPNRLWPPLAVIGVVLVGIEAIQLAPFGTFEGRLFLIQIAVSFLFVAPLGYAFLWFGAFGDADAKAMIVLAIFLPTFPTYTVVGMTLPAVGTDLGVFSLTILTNAVLIAAFVPLVLAGRNLAGGHIEPKAMFFARPVSIDSIPDRHGRLFETPEGISRHGLDLDALRMYLRWRGTTLDALRTDPDSHRNPETIETTHDPTDGGTHIGPQTDGGVDLEHDENAVAVSASPPDDQPVAGGDPWGADRFFDSIEGSAYGSSPARLREALDLLASADGKSDVVWVSPELPFIVPMFVGLVIAFLYGDLLFGLLGWLAVV